MSCCSVQSNIVYTVNRSFVNVYQTNGVTTLDVRMKGFISSSLSKTQTVFQRIELLEKGAELVDETFHLMNRVFKAYCSTPIFKLLSETHHAAHQLEHVFHSFCFLGDVYRFKNWLSDDKAKKDTTYLYAASRVCHTVAHLFASLSFLKDLEIISGTYPLKNQHFVNMIGYGLGTMQLFKNRIQKKTNENFKTDLGIQLGGFVYESLSYSSINSSAVNKIIALAGIIHAFSVIHRLLPSQQQLDIHQTLTKSTHSHNC